MVSATSVNMAIMLLFALFAISSALDMSIISYDKAHPDKATGRTEEEVMSLYEEWLVKHGKLYNALGEKDKRFQIFKNNLQFVDEINSANRTYRLGLNRFADLTNEEYRARYLGTIIDPNRRLGRTPSNRYTPRVGDALPDSVDWRKEAVVVPVKDQGSCCKQFATLYCDLLSLTLFFIFFLNWKNFFLIPSLFFNLSLLIRV
ncbi:hypothetical protein V8G54_035134 [Vigna mungo]|uniref:Cathepsin propeptide inhibitor domain-containing protein n=1 Tax=Vigna mungo TaxID=3915 RepID=A0AAQ3RFE0_VIGMU